MFGKINKIDQLKECWAYWDALIILLVFKKNLLFNTWSAARQTFLSLNAANMVQTLRPVHTVRLQLQYFLSQYCANATSQPLCNLLIRSNNKS